MELIITPANLAAKYARELAQVEIIYHTVQAATINLNSSRAEMEQTAKLLKGLLDKNLRLLLIPIGSGRYVLVHSHGGYAQIDIIEESK